MTRKKDLNQRQKNFRLMLLGLLLGLSLVLGLGLVQRQVLLLLVALVWQGLGLSLLMALVWLLLGLVLKKLESRKRQPSKTIIKSKTQLPRWVHAFLRDEEKAGILLEYRLSWYGSKRPNKWIRFKVLVMTLHHIFYEVWFKERLDKVKSFQVRIPRR